MLEVRNAYLGFAAVFHTCVLQEARLRPTTFAHHSTFSAFPQKSTPLLTPLKEYSALLEARGKMLEVRNVYLGFAAVFHTCVLQEARLRPTTFAHHSTFSAFPQKSTPLLTPLKEYSALLEARGKMLEVRNVYLGFAPFFHTCVLQEARGKTSPHNLCSSFHILRFSQKIHAASHAAGRIFCPIRG